MTQIKFATTAISLFAPNFPQGGDISKKIVNFVEFGKDAVYICAGSEVINDITDISYMWFREIYLSIDKCRGVFAVSETY